ncbi:kinetochore component CENP-S-domain-containing protein [Trichophaea hybrida]|nr:kinetochore component CENP-S-domain-containing protein [Trichophaea hybrida]
MSLFQHQVVRRERLKSALWFIVGKAIDHEALELDVNVTLQFIGAVTEMVFGQIESVTKDIESFTRHANRGTISSDDVLFLARRNTALDEILRHFVAQKKLDRNNQKTVNEGEGRC